MALRCFQLIFRDMLDADALLVMARGIGVRVLLTKFLKLYSSAPGLVLVLNLRGEEQLLRDALLADGLRDTHLPTNLDANVSAPARKQAYAKGGCVMVTSRILIVDLLMQRILPTQVAGILVANAHRVGDQSPEAFILKLIKDAHPAAFVKGFSDDPETLSSGFNRLEKTMRALYTPKLYIWPRYHEILSQELASVSPAPEIIELSLPLTPAQVAIQRSILQCMDECITTLRRSTGSRIDISDFTIENGLFESFDVLIRRQLDPYWNTLKPRVRALVGDLKLFRKLLNYVVRYDAVSFYTFLDMVRANAIQQVQALNIAAGGRGGGGAGIVESEWLLSDRGEALVRAAKARLYSLVETPGLFTPGQLPLVPEDSPVTVTASSKEEPLWARRGTHIHVEEVVPGVKNTAATGGGRGGSRSKDKGALSHDVARRVGLSVALETNPKWDLLVELLEEVAEAAAVLDSKSGGASSGRSGAARVLIAVKDERTAAQVQEVLAGGTDRMLRRGWERFLLKTAARTRRLRAAVLDSAPLAQPPVSRGTWQTVQEQLIAAVPREVAELLSAAELPGWKSAEKQVEPPAPAAQGEGAAAGVPAPAPLSAVIAAPAVRPQVLPENRLLWKAAAVAIEAERRRLMRRHMRLLWLDNLMRRRGSGSSGSGGAGPGGGGAPAPPAPVPVDLSDDDGIEIVEKKQAASKALELTQSSELLGLEEDGIDLSALPAATQAEMVALQHMDLEELLARDAALRTQVNNAVRSAGESSGGAELAASLGASPEVVLLSQALASSPHGAGAGTGARGGFGGVLDIADWTAGGEDGGDGEAGDSFLLQLLQSGLLASAAGAKTSADGGIEAEEQSMWGALGVHDEDEVIAARMADEDDAAAELAAKLSDASGGNAAVNDARARHLAAALSGLEASSGGADAVTGKKRSRTVSGAAAASAGATSSTGSGAAKRPRLADSDSTEVEVSDDDEEGLVKEEPLEEDEDDQEDDTDAALAVAAATAAKTASTSARTEGNTGGTATGVGILLQAHRGGGGGGGKRKAGHLAVAPAAAAPSDKRAAKNSRGQPYITLIAPADAPAAATAATTAGTNPSLPRLRSPPGPAITVTPLPPGPQVVVYPLSRADARMSLLADFRPTFVIVYDPDPAFTRELEVYAATLGRGQPLRIYYLVYSASAEEQRYLSQLKKERDAFEKTIMAKAHMAPPPPSVSAAAAAAVTAPVVVRKGAVDGWGIRVHDEDLDGRAGGTAGALWSLTDAAGRAGGPNSGSTSSIGGGGLVGRQRVSLANVRPLTVDIRWEDKGRRLVVVDMREFRAKLPLRLYNAGLNPVPATLEVGDFVLSPDMCVERKSVPDLLGSLASGRLYTQAEAMTRYYKRPVLCIEFDEDRPYALLPGDVPPDIDVSSPISKLVLLLIHFPTLRMLWCRDPTATATTFASLKQLEAEPDVATAVAMGTGAAPAASGGGGGGGAGYDPEDLDPTDSAVAGFSASSRPQERPELLSRAPRGEAVLGFDPRNLTGMEMLRRFPGVNATNYRALAAAAGSLRGLATMSKEALIAVIGRSNGGLLHNFLHAKHAAAL